MFDFITNIFGGGYAGGKVSLTPDQKREVDAIIKEMITIGIKEDYLSERPGGAYNGQCHHKRTREIGERLNSIAGIELMQKVFFKVKKKVGKNMSEHLEYAWSGIGQWMA